jgi:hypothetical protein
MQCHSLRVQGGNPGQGSRRWPPGRKRGSVTPLSPPAPCSTSIHPTGFSGSLHRLAVTCELGRGCGVPLGAEVGQPSQLRLNGCHGLPTRGSIPPYCAIVHMIARSVYEQRVQTKLGEQTVCCVLQRVCSFDPCRRPGGPHLRSLRGWTDRESTLRAQLSE